MDKGGDYLLKQELTNRMKVLQESMKRSMLDSYIVTAEDDIWYFTNINYKPEERPFFIIVTLDEKPKLVVPKMEERHLHKGIMDVEVITYWDYPSPKGEGWHERVNEIGGKLNRTGIEKNVNAEIYLNIHVKELVPMDLVAEQRKVKSLYELERIKWTCKITDNSMAEILKSARKGVTAFEMFSLSGNTQKELIKLNQYDPVMTTLLTVVWPAPISAMPHSIPTVTDKLGAGPNIAMSYFRVNGYSAENERTFFVEKPGKEDRELFNHMMNAREQALKLVKAGVGAADIDSAAREYLAKNGLKDTLLHRTGHGIGLANHEGPFIAEGSNEILKENMVISIEPGIYVDGVGGYRHSDTVLVTKDGYELLTHAPLELEDLIIT